MAERADIIEPATAAAFDHWHDVVCLPKMPGTVGSFAARLCHGIRTAQSADTAIPLECFLAQITRISAESPFMNTLSRAERTASLRHHSSASAAQWATLRIAQ